MVIPLVETSEEAAKKFRKPVELVFVDGDHEYESVMSDFESWFPKVIEGGWMAFHDSIAVPGVRTVVQSHVLKSSRFARTRFIGSILLAQKVGKASQTQRLRSYYILALMNLYRLGLNLPLAHPLRTVAGKLARVLQ